MNIRSLSVITVALVATAVTILTAKSRLATQQLVQRPLTAEEEANKQLQLDIIRSINPTATDVQLEQIWLQTVNGGQYSPRATATTRVAIRRILMTRAAARLQ